MNNKKKRRFGFVLALILAAVLQIGGSSMEAVHAAGITVTVNNCVIAGQNVNVTATSTCLLYTSDAADEVLMV